MFFSVNLGFSDFARLSVTIACSRRPDAGAAGQRPRYAYPNPAALTQSDPDGRIRQVDGPGLLFSGS
jgi:hypothetical protein